MPGTTAEPAVEDDRATDAPTVAGGTAEPDEGGTTAGGSAAAGRIPAAREAGDDPSVGSTTGTTWAPLFADRTDIPRPRTEAAAPPADRDVELDLADATAEQDTEPDTDPDGDAEDDLDELITGYPSARPGGTGSIHGIGLTVLVTDLRRSISFYRDTLGFAEIDSGDSSAILASGDTRIVLREIPEVSPITRRLVHLNLEVGDVQAVYEELRAKDVRFTYAPRAVNRGARLELWAAAFRDPDGHGIAITQWRSRGGD